MQLQNLVRMHVIVCEDCEVIIKQKDWGRPEFQDIHFFFSSILKLEFNTSKEIYQRTLGASRESSKISPFVLDQSRKGNSYYSESVKILHFFLFLFSILSHSIF